MRRGSRPHGHRRAVAACDRGRHPEEIASDYELSNQRLRPLYAELGEEDQGAWAEERLRRANTSARALILDTLASLDDVDAYLYTAGIGDDDLAAIRARLLE